MALAQEYQDPYINSNSKNKKDSISSQINLVGPKVMKTEQDSSEYEQISTLDKEEYKSNEGAVVDDAKRLY